jgi:V-type H+-transporting ATPase subunit a
MGIFSVYTGIIYNDVFSKAINVFGSSWRVGVTNEFDFGAVTTFSLNPDPNPNVTFGEVKMFSGEPYPFGLDPVWQVSANAISFTNSLKMKFSVIIGIMQMAFGLILSLLNHLFFNRKLDIFFGFIPQLIFLTFIFIYLCVMIFIKWLTFSGSPSVYKGPQCAPNLLIELINMFFLTSSSVGDGNACKSLYTGQLTVQTILIILAVLCIPVMLLVKPIILYIRHKKKSQRGRRLSDGGHINPVALNHSATDITDSANVNLNVENSNMNNSPTKLNDSLDDIPRGSTDKDSDHEDEEFDMGEIAVEQCIHTIEYFLGCISHTASYLRLWALSLAHAELSEVLWTMVLDIGLKGTAVYSFIILWAVFAVWATFTVGVLLLMEGLSAFLHALRLHWVEFQSKFYKGEGYEFLPLSFERILEEAEIAEPIK